MAKPKRIKPSAARTLMAEGALLVCVYPPEAYARSHLEGALSMEALTSRALSKDSRLIFY